MVAMLDSRMPTVGTMCVAMVDMMFLGTGSHSLFPFFAGCTCLRGTNTACGIARSGLAAREKRIGPGNRRPTGWVINDPPEGA
jgi:hypothetical protein